MTVSTNPEMTIERVSWNDPRAVAFHAMLVDENAIRYADLAVRDNPELFARMQQALAVDPADVVATLLAIDADGTPIGHAAVRMLDDEWEIKRVIVAMNQRGRGIAGMLMAELETIASDAGARRLILQTGNRQPEAVALYNRLGYFSIPIYEPYVETMPTSRCFEKLLA